MKKIRVILFILILTGSIAQAQDKGIHFENGLNWQQVQDKAKKGNKLIFMDCYATWCGPCKLMDQYVYPDSSVGNFVNEHFISVKVQIDKTAKDDDNIRNWYKDADTLGKTYNVTSLPAFLFFLPNGKLIHRDGSLHSTAYFLKAAMDATDANKQEYALLEKFRKGKLPDSAIPGLITVLSKAGEKPAANEVAQSYIHDYLLKLPDALLFKKENITLMGTYIKSSADKAVFDLFFKRSQDADKVTRKDFSDDVIFNIILNEDIIPKLWSDAKQKNPISNKPDWASLKKAIEQKYNAHYADETVTFIKFKWYQKTKEWKEMAEAELDQIEKYWLDADGKLQEDQMMTVNNWLYDLSIHITDKAVLSKFLKLELMIVNKHPDETDYLDTYAILLYKMGKKNNALDIEKKAVYIKQQLLAGFAADIQKEIREGAEQDLKELQSHLQGIKSNNDLALK